LVLGLSLLATPAVAKPALLVLSLDAPGFPERTIKKLDAAIRKEVRASTKRRYSLLPKPKLPFLQMKLAVGCVDDGAECLSKIASTLGAARVFQTALRGNPREARLVLTLVDRRPGDADRRSADLTEITPDSAEEIRVHVAAMFGVKRRAPPGKLALYVASDIGKLDGAEIMLDDKQIPRASLNKLPAGQHRLEIRQQGFETFVWLGRVRPGRSTRVAVKFVPTRPADAPVADPTPPVVARMPEPKRAAPAADPAPESSPAIVTTPAKREKSGRVISWIFGGATVAAAAVGLVHSVFVLEGQSEMEEKLGILEAECSGIESCRTSPREDKLCLTPPGGGLCYKGRRDAAVATASWIGAGVLAAGTVLAFFLEPSGEPTVTGGVAPTDGGAAAALHVRF